MDEFPPGVNGITEIRIIYRWCCRGFVFFIPVAAHKMLLDFTGWIGHESRMNSQVIIGYGQNSPEAAELADECAAVLQDFGIRHSAVEGLSATKSLLDPATAAVIWIASEALELTELNLGTELPVLAVPMISEGAERHAGQVAMTESGAGTLAIGPAGAKNAALAAVALIARWSPAVRDKLAAFRQKQTSSVLAMTLPNE